MRARLGDCFPDPLTPHWPSTANPVTCEARQVYALTAIACCVPRAHVLVLHDQEATNHLRSCMTRGCKYMDFEIERTTTAEELGHFLHSAQLHAFPSLRSLNSFTNMSVREKMTSTHGGVLSEHSNNTTTVGNTAIMDCIVVSIRGAHQASSNVLSTLIDAVHACQVRCIDATAEKAHRDPAAVSVTHSIPSVHIVLFCRQKGYTDVLSERLRSGFALSTFVSSLTMDRAPVLRGNNIRNSSIINKRNMMELLSFPESLSTVTCSYEVTGYLRHLLLVLRGSMLPGNTTGCYAVRRFHTHVQVLRAAAVLFQPPPEALVARVLPDSVPQRRTVLTDRNNNSMLSTPGGIGPPDFTHVVVTPTDVLCLLCPLVAHLETLRRRPLRFLSSTLRGQESGSSQHNKGLPLLLHVSQPSVGEEGDMISHVSPRAGASLEDVDGKESMMRLSPPHSGPTGSRPLGSAKVTRAYNNDANETYDEAANDELLSYTEVREFLRLVIINYSAPAPG